MKNHAKATELWVGYYKMSSKRPSITWPESVDEALCFGWIDGLRKSIDEESYKIRFTPRKKTSIWSAVNVARVAELEKLGKMTEAGRVAFSHRRDDRTGIYGHDRKTEAALPATWQAKLEKDRVAWAWFSARAPSYRRTAIHWVMSAKQEATRERRFEELLSASRRGTTVKPLTSPSAKKPTTKAVSRNKG